MASEIVRKPGEGKKVLFLGSEITLKVAAKDSGGLFSAVEVAIAGGAHGPPPHIHYAHDEFFYVLEGEVRLPLDGREIVATAGVLIFRPRGMGPTYLSTGRKAGEHPCSFSNRRHA